MLGNKQGCKIFKNNTIVPNIQISLARCVYKTRNRHLKSVVDKTRQGKRARGSLDKTWKEGLQNMLGGKALCVYPTSIPDTYHC